MSRTTMQILVTSPRVFFVPKPSDVVETLFKGPTTASGTFQVKRNGVLFFNLRGEPEAFLVANHNAQPFFVTCRQAEINGKRRLRYMYGLVYQTQEFLGITSLTYMQASELAASLWAEVQPIAC